MSITELLEHWIEFASTFNEQAARISNLGLLAVLKATCSDIELASMKIKKGGKYSEKPHETVLLQTKLVSELARFLVTQVKPENHPEEKNDEDDYGDYGDDSYGNDSQGEFAEDVSDAFDNSVENAFNCGHQEDEEEDKMFLGDILLCHLQFEGTSKQQMAEFVKHELSKVG